MPDIRIECPRCQQRLAVDPAGAGQSITCPHCGNALVVPVPAPAPSPVIAPPPVPAPTPTSPPRPQAAASPVPQPKAAAVPPPLPALSKRAAGLATTALILGIVGLVPALGIPFALTGLVLGIVALVKKTTAKGRAIAGIALGGVTIALTPVYVALLVPAFAAARSAAHQAHCAANLKAIGLQLSIYQQSHGGALPKDLNQLVKDGLVPESLLHCPLRAAAHEHDNFAFHFPAGSPSAETMLVWDASEHHIAKTKTGRNVLFGDMSVRFVAEADFQQQAAARKRTSPQNKPGGTAARPAGKTNVSGASTARPVHTVQSTSDPAAILADLKSNDDRRLQAALSQLVRTKPDAPNPDITRALTTILHDGNTSARLKAAMALEKWGTKENLPALEQAAGDTNPLVANHAKKAIAAINSR